MISNYLKNNFLKKIFFILQIVVLLFVLGGCEKPVEKKPNILWIYVEDLSPWMSCYGYENNETPNLDDLANNGVKFTNAFMPAPVCSPTRSAIITGTMQTTNGFHNHRSSRNKIAPIYLPENVETIPQLFRKGGYNTFNIGKEDYNFIFDRNDLYYESSPKPKRLFYKMEPNQFGKYFVQDNSDKPFFGQVMLMGGKNRGEIENPIDREEVLIPPYYPENEIIREAVARHYDQARITDREVGDLLKLMNIKGFLENTIVFFFSDHGFNTGIRHKQFCYDSGLHVPFIVTQFGSEGEIKKGEIRNDLVSGIDIATTSLALAGIDIPDNMEGNDLFAENFEQRDFVISARDRCDYTIDYIRTVRTKRYRYIRNFLTDRAYMQPQYRDPFPFTQTMKKII